MDRQSAAALLGMPVREIRSADDNWIVTHDGAQYEVPDGLVARWVRTNPKQTPPRFHAELVEDEPVDEDPAVDVDGDGVPDGTANQILEWVGDDPDRAAAALAVERAKGATRKTLVAALEKLAG